MEYDLQTKVRVLDRIKDETQLAVAKDEGVSRRSIALWKKDEDAIRGEWLESQVEREVFDTDDEMGIVKELEKRYLAKLEGVGKLEERKKVFVAGLEKVMWDHLNALDGDLDVKADVRVKMLKDLNEIREKLSGEPSVIMEYRYRFQMVVMEVVKDMIPERAEEFLTKVKRLEDELE